MKLAVRPDRCSGCRVCELTCAVTMYGEQNPKKSALRVSGKFPAPGKYVVATCDQCGLCAEACPVDAITEHKGIWIINADECTGCLLCVDACPRGAMFTHSSQSEPFKCTACGACIQYCPREALFDEEVAGQ